MRTANKFHATQKHQRMRRPCCQVSESAYVSIECGKDYETKSQRRYLTILPEFEMWAIHGHVPSFAGFRQIGRRRQGMGCMQECNAGSMIAVDRSGSSSQLLYLRCRAV
jgi:hypothetical protein